MTEDADRLAIWDEELEDLAARVVAVFGDDEVPAAIERTLVQLRLARPAAVSFADYKMALKAELRRLVRPQ